MVTKKKAGCVKMETNLMNIAPTYAGEQSNMFETEATLFERAINQPLSAKISNAIDMIGLHEQNALAMNQAGYYVSFSGGKDSIVMAKLFEMARIKYGLHYNNVTIDPPELTRFIKQEYQYVQWHSIGKPLPYAMVDKSCGPPTRKARWCCEMYKEHGGDGCFKAIGVRAMESNRRKMLWKLITANKRGGMFICPIVYWTDKDIWSFIQQFKLRYCHLYDEGFKRLGCVGCPMAGPKRQAADFARWPKIERVWRKGFQMYWDEWKGVPTKKGEARWIERFSNVDELWAWWISGKACRGKANCQLFLW